MKKSIETFIDWCRKMGAADGKHGKAIERADAIRANELEEIQKRVTDEIRKALNDKAALKATRAVFMAGWKEGNFRRESAEFRQANNISTKVFDSMPDGPAKAALAKDRETGQERGRKAWQREKSLAMTGTKTGTEKKKRGTKAKKAKPAATVTADPVLSKLTKTAKDEPIKLALLWAAQHPDIFMAWAATVMPKA